MTYFSTSCLRQQFIYGSTEDFHWEIPESAWDKLKLKNNGLYLVEGIGALTVQIGEDSEDVRHNLGHPKRRSFETYDELYFERRTFSGTVYLFHGKVVKIRLIVNDHNFKVVQWRTALGLDFESFSDKTVDEAMNFILTHYDTPQHLRKKNGLIIHSRGISFFWSSNKLSYIEIYKPWDNYN